MEQIEKLEKRIKSLEKKPHAVCIPCAAQGHINPMVTLAKILHSKGFHITFVNTDYNHNRLLRSRGPNALEGLPSFQFKAIPDGLPPIDADVTQPVAELCLSTEKTCLGPFRKLLQQLNESSELPPVTCIVSDVGMFFTLDAAEELGIPEVMLWTGAACSFWGCNQYPKLVEMGIVPFEDASFLSNGDLDMVLDWVTGMKDIRLRDITSFIRTTDPDDVMLNYVTRMISNSKRPSAIIVNTFDALEHDVLQAISVEFPAPLYAVGPLHIILDSIEARDEQTKSISLNLWKEDTHCLEWLDQYAPSSVVYVNYGSITVMTNDHLIEFAWGLASSKLPFLWIIRPDLVTGDSAILPSEFAEETKNRRLIATWCNQEQVLAHPAIGGFLTHSGWNSTLESICNGVPMICWPFFADQQTNCWFCCTKWGTGMEIDTNVKRNEVQRQVTELMKGEKGKEMKKKVMEWKDLAHKATSVPDGSSYASLDNVIAKVLLSSGK